MNANEEVSRFLDLLNHPLKQEIEDLRQIILSTDARLSENIKWNAPNYSIGSYDRITMKIHPPNQIQLIFHRGAKVLDQPKERLLKDDMGILIWKTNDRAVATFKSKKDIETNKGSLEKIIRDWLSATIR